MRLLGFLAAILLFCASASAGVTGLENSIMVGESAYKLSFFVDNASGVKLPLSVEFHFPSEYSVVKGPAFVAAKSNKGEVVVKVFPKKGLEGNTYTGTIIIDLGGNRAEKNIAITFFEEDSCPLEARITAQENGSIKLSLENKSYKSKTVQLSAVKGLPSGAAIEGVKEFSLGAFEKRDYELTVKSGSGFEADAEFEFTCKGVANPATVSEPAKIKYGQGNGSADASTGFAVFGLGGIAGGELLVDAVLVLVAAVLLIAFIARMVKILTAGKKQGRAK